MRSQLRPVHLAWALVALCTGLTAGWGCSGGDGATPAATCGNSAVEAGEQCDGGAPRACTASCGTTGTQACVSCAWEATCAPPAEICNGADDDCDGVVDEDLAAVDVDFVGTPSWRGLFGATNLGSFYEDACPAGEVAIGFDGELTTSGYVGALRPHCGTASATCADSTCTAAVVPGTTLPLRGTGTGGGTFSALCPDQQVIVGYGGWFDGGTVNLIRGLTFRCAPLEVTPPGTEWTAALGSAGDLTPVGGTTGNTGRVDCASGQAATSVVIRAGAGVHALGISCQTPAKTCP